MLSETEINSAFQAIAYKWVQMPVSNRSQARSQVASFHRELRMARDAFTAGISKLWKERFKEIKDENDRLQKAVKDYFAEWEKYDSEIDDAERWEK